MKKSELIKIIKEEIKRYVSESDEWWTKLSSEEQANYIKMHPNSKKAKEGKKEVEKKSDNKKDDFSFLNKKTDKELSKLLDVIRAQQEINGKQYMDAKKKGQDTTSIEKAGERLLKREDAIIKARVKKFGKKRG